MTRAIPRILVVDDSADNRALLVQLLEDDYHVSEATNGVEALAAIALQRPDLVLLDLLMPVMDGFGVLERLRHQSGTFLPVIVVTAATEPGARLHALSLGAHELLSKPIDGQELVVRVRNMLALKDARHAAERRADELEALVAERTQEIAEQNDRLLAADKFKDDFLVIISHELRTPLNFIMSFASVLEDEVQGPLSSEQLKSVGSILDGSERMLALVEALLVMGQIQAGRFSLYLEPVALVEAIAGVVEKFLPRALQKGIRLTTDLSGPFPSLMADPRRLSQALANLLDNAIKFTPQDGEVTVTARLEDHHIVCEVRDTGVGMAHEEISLAFQRFQQLDMSSTRNQGGIGLGLAIAKAFVEAHGGSIKAASQPGAGTTFEFSLPLDTHPVELVPALDGAAVNPTP
jgi:signal transduction histidine kinase